MREPLARLLQAAGVAFSNRYMYGLLVFLGSSVVFALRLIPNLASPGAGADYGHYLIAANWYAGSDHSGEGPFDPPVVPLIVLFLQLFFGKLTAIHILGPLAGAALVPCGAHLIGRVAPRALALAGAIVFALWQSFTEFLAFGGPTNLFGIAFSLLFFRQMSAALVDRRTGWKPTRREIEGALLLLLIVSTHHFTTLITGSTVLVWLGFEILMRRAKWRATVATFARVISLAAVPALVYLPYLLSLVEADSEGGFGTGANLTQFFETAATLWRLTPELWAPLGALGAVGLVRLRRDLELWPLVAAIALTPLALEVTVMASHPVRTLYFLEFPLVLLACTWFVDLPPANTDAVRTKGVEKAGRLLVTALIAALLLVLPATTPAYQAQVDAFHHSQLPRGAFEAFDWVAANTAPTDTIAIDGAIAPGWFDAARGSSMGWWLEGYANRRALYEANLGLLPFKAKWPDARNATRLFAGENTFEDGVVRMADTFPTDDSAMPVVDTGYFNDYHEFIGFGAPRFFSASDGSIFWLNVATQGAADVRYDRTSGSITGQYAGPGFSGSRAAALDGSAHEVTFEFRFSYPSLGPYDVFGLTLYAAPVVVLDSSQFSNGSIDASIPNTLGFQLGRATISFELENLSAPSLRPGSSVWGKWGYELAWTIEKPEFVLRGRVHFTQPPTGGPGEHPVYFSNAARILHDNAVRYLFIDALAVSDLRRFDLQPGSYTRAFANSGVVIYRVL